VGNLAGVDTLGGSLTGPTNAITSVTVLRQPSNGTLLNTGLGTYNYTPNPGFAGLDQFVYSVQDSTGVDSKNTATAWINVERNGPTVAANPNLIASIDDGTNNVYKYTAGVVTTFFTPTFLGSTILTPGVSTLAVNRGENLVYFTANIADVADRGKIYAYDYANNQEFLLIDSATSPLFSGAVNFNQSGGTYGNGQLYIGVAGVSSTYYKLSLQTYDPTIPSQTVTVVSTITASTSLILGGMVLNSATYGLTRTGNSGGNGAYAVITADVGVGTISGAIPAIVAPPLPPSSALSNNGIVYVSSSTNIFALNLSDGSTSGTYPGFASNVIELGDWVNIV